MKRVGVVGAGQMGAGIAQVCASIGKAVTLCDIKQDFVDNGIASIQKNLQRNVSKGRMSQNQMDDTLGNVSTSLDNEALRKKLVINGYRFASENFSVDIAVDRLNKLIQETLK